MDPKKRLWLVYQDAQGGVLLNASVEAADTAEEAAEIRLTEAYYKQNMCYVVAIGHDEAHVFMAKMRATGQIVKAGAGL